MSFGILTKKNSYTLYQKAKPSNLGIRQFLFLLRCHSKFLFSHEFYTLQKVIILGSIEWTFNFFVRDCIHILASKHKVTSFKKTPHHWKSGMLLVSLDTYAYHPSHSRTWASKMYEASIDP